MFQLVLVPARTNSTVKIAVCKPFCLKTMCDTTNTPLEKEKAKQHLISCHCLLSQMAYPSFLFHDIHKCLIS